MDRQNYKKVKIVLWAVMLTNLTICAMKIALGAVIKSASLTADGFHNLSDASANIVGLIGIALASRPVDEDHPYGHSKFETLAGMGIAAILTVVGFEIVVGAVGKFAHPVVPEVSIISLAALLATLCVNILTTTIERRQGMKLNSQILLSDSTHTRSDIYVTLGVLLTLAGIRLGLPAVIDPIASLLVAGFIFFAAWQIFRLTSVVLLDRAAEDKERIIRIAMSVENVKGVHKVKSRSAGSVIFIELHVQMDNDLSVEQSHACVHRIIAAIREELGQSTQVIIHTEPFYEVKNKQEGNAPQA